MKVKKQVSSDLPLKNSKLYLLFTLSAMTAFAPLVTDMYLPCLPALTAYFDTSVSLVQLTISTSMIGIAAGQLFFGPVSDKTGRRRPLFASFVLYLLSTVGCLFARNIYLLIGFRLLQGLGAAGSIVISRSVATDLFQGKDLLSFLALIAAVQGIAPIVAPVSGGVLLLFTGWRGIFFFLGILGLFVFGVSAYLKESLPPHKRAKIPAVHIFKLFVPVMKNRLLMLYIALLSFSMAIMFAYIASSPFIFQEHYGVSPVAYSIFFAVNALALTVGNILSAKLKNPRRTLKYSVAGLFVCSLLTGVTLIFDTSVVYFCLALFMSLFFAGAIFPVSTNLALDLEEKYKGTASAILGASTFLVGGIVMPLSGVGNILHSTAYTMTGSALATLILLFAIDKTTINPDTPYL
ncbi:MAG: multidrug effflux MFS transporter [Bacteroidales bacterium]|jgi:DHA1 family bicyclomycin/chloramphenicol resistance-like MFS transporter|nr:multidrug effflux MFS transporter [Bacteroidales bacterium]